MVSHAQLAFHAFLSSSCQEFWDILLSFPFLSSSHNLPKILQSGIFWYDSERTTLANG
ncbi:hypothetical protein BT96DRAFT_923720 [Gymnopus androsaceus JB14]|uniref:Uncharacterized protein n=1 Tax=Gymnopus androsaceus JB14 TaxID=1447944 RepID=A0A6A4H7D8_9AGAR|nr:hypothetical protein BT96DRAFT_923720 [Gymnopus androsaceus JB14]